VADAVVIVGFTVFALPLVFVHFGKRITPPGQLAGNRAETVALLAVTRLFGIRHHHGATATNCFIVSSHVATDRTLPIRCVHLESLTTTLRLFVSMRSLHIPLVSQATLFSLAFHHVGLVYGEVLPRCSSTARCRGTWIGSSKKTKIQPTVSQRIVGVNAAVGVLVVVVLVGKVHFVRPHRQRIQVFGFLGLLCNDRLVETNRQLFVIDRDSLG